MNENQLFFSFSAEVSATVPSSAACPPLCRTAASSFQFVPRRRDPWFHQLMDLACDGIEEAVHDLWVNYGYDFTEKGRVDE